MGRLSHIKLTIDSVLNASKIQYLLVDYECPDRSGNWVEKYKPRANVLRMKALGRMGGKPLFNKSIALNYGARSAFSWGASHVLFIDADTVANDLSWTENILNDTFYIPDHKINDIGLYGMLLVPKAGFEKSGGYDESMTGYGVEDIDMRLRLYYLSKLKFSKVSQLIGHSIPHSDMLRTKFYGEKKKEITQRNNILRMHDNFKTLNIPLEELYKDPVQMSIIKELSGI